MNTYHVGVESSHELAGTSGHGVDVVESVVEVTGLEVVRNSGVLRAGEVEDVRVGHGQGGDAGLQAGRLAVVAHDDTEPVAGVVDVAGGADSVEDQVVLLAAACHQGVDRGDLVAHEAELGAMALLHRPHGPDVVHERGDGDGDLDGDEDPGLRVDLLGDLLRGDDAVDAQSEVGEVHGGSEEDQEGDQLEELALPAAPDLGVVALVKSRDLVAALHPFLVENRRRLAREQSLQTLVALVLFTMSANVVYNSQIFSYHWAVRRGIS